MCVILGAIFPKLSPWNLDQKQNNWKIWSSHISYLTGNGIWLHITLTFFDHPPAAPHSLTDSVTGCLSQSMSQSVTPTHPTTKSLWWGGGTVWGEEWLHGCERRMFITLTFFDHPPAAPHSLTDSVTGCSSQSMSQSVTPTHPTTKSLWWGGGHCVGGGEGRDGL